MDEEKRLKSEEASAKLKTAIDEKVEMRLEQMMSSKMPHDGITKAKVDPQLRIGEELIYYDRKESPMKLAIPTLLIGLLFTGIAIGGAIEVGIDNMEEGIIVLLVGLIVLWCSIYWLISYSVTYYFVTDKRLCLRTINLFFIHVNRDIQAGSILNVKMEESSAPLSKNETTKHYLVVDVKNEKNAVVKSISNSIILMKYSIEKLK